METVFNNCETMDLTSNALAHINREFFGKIRLSDENIIGDFIEGIVSEGEYDESPLAKIKSIDEWFEVVKDAKAFIVNGMVCGDFSFPSPDDEDDDSYAFYIYKEHERHEIFVSNSETKTLIIESASEVRIITEKEVISLEALY
ncbi:hypothetical protein A3715_10335 [Oleiphilus sp. HI0009]|nr:hypothetical protein A3715_10335 [Oleiphilus sp. HI0009]